MSSLKHISLLCLWLSFVLGLAGAGCGSSQPTNQNSHATTGSESQVVGANPTDEQLLASVLNGVPNLKITKIEFAASPGCPGDCPDPLHPNGRWMYITLTAGGPADTVLAKWQAMLTVGAFRDQAHAIGGTEVIGYTPKVVYPDGTTDQPEVLISQPFDHRIPGLTSQKLIDRISEDAVKAQLQVRDVSFAIPQERAPIISLTIENETAGLSDAARSLEVLRSDLVDFNNPLAEGMYVEIRNKAGDLTFATAYSVRMGQGTTWVKPEFASLIEIPEVLSTSP